MIGKRAKSSIFYYYTHHINGFAASLDEETAKELSKHPDVKSVIPDKAYKLHTTHLWQFLGLTTSQVYHGWMPSSEKVSSMISEEKYVNAIKEEINKVVKLQEELDIDVLVHGGPERNDMVEYFGEQLSGFASQLMVGSNHMGHDVLSHQSSMVILACNLMRWA